MTPSGRAADTTSRLDRLLGFLERDPNNLQLIADAATAALDEGAFGQARTLIDRYAATTPPPAALLNIQGLVAINEQHFKEAASVFEGLQAGQPSDPGIAFNLAWCKAMLQDYSGALALLNEIVTSAVPRAAALKIQMMHHLGLLEDALTVGAALAEHYPTDHALMGALAIVAIDAGQVDLAKAYGGRAGEGHEGLSTLGMLELGGDRIDQSMALFDRALLAYPNSARGLLGKGLGLLAKGDPDAAAAYIDQSAEAFGGHLGTWVAAGWAYFVRGDLKSSRKRFERALALDDTFAETHGALAVLDIAEGDLESAKRRTEIALRLDPKCFAGALAKSLLVAGAGDAATAERIRNIALNSPVGPGGRTIAQAMVGLGMAAGKPASLVPTAPRLEGR